MRFRATTVVLTLALGLLAGSVPAEAQKAGKVYRIAVLRPTFSAFRTPGAVSFGALPIYLQWLAKFGYAEGQNVLFEDRIADSDRRLPELAAQLVRLSPHVIVAEGMPAIRAAARATRRIPIVMLADGDPVTAGFVASLARPARNVTGITVVVPELFGKRLELLKETVPSLRLVAVLWNPAYSGKAEEWEAMQAAAQALRVELRSLEVRSREDIGPALEKAVAERAGALVVLDDALTFSYWQLITGLAIKGRLPSIYTRSFFVQSLTGGYNLGLMSYGESAADLAQRVSTYVDKILKGARPADLPVERPAKFELIINMNTAKALGLTIPPSVLIRADRVIE